MKKIFLAFIAAAALAVATPASAQLYSVNTIMDGGTNNIAGNADGGTSVVNQYTNGSYEITATLFDSVALLVQAKGLSTTNAVIKFYFDQYLDGGYTYSQSNWVGTNQFMFQLIVAGTNTIQSTTNLNIGAVGYLRLNKIENVSSNAVTNITIKYATKPVVRR